MNTHYSTTNPSPTGERAGVRLLLLLILCILPHIAMAQPAMRMASFQAVPTDLSAQGSARRNDVNGNAYALVKVTSASPTDDLRAYRFDFGLLAHEVDAVDHPDGLYVYVQKGAKHVSISRQGYAPIMKQSLGMTLEAGGNYAMQMALSGPVEQVQLVHFELRPATQATVMVRADGGSEELFGMTDSDGGVAKALPLGTYTYRVLTTDYEAVEGRFTLQATAVPETHKETLTLTPTFAEVTLRAAAGAEIYVDEQLVGRGTWTGRFSDARQHYVVCRLEGHEPSETNISVRRGEKRTVDLPSPTPITGLLSVTSRPLGATIVVDGTECGTTPAYVRDLLIGSHQVTLRRSGHRDHTQSVDIRRGETTQLDVELVKVAAQSNQGSPNAQRTPTASSPDPLGLCPDAHHPHAIDMGTGVKFACCNVGASTPADYGDYFAWGETSPKSDYSWSTYKWCNGRSTTMTKYCTSSSFGTVDNLRQLELSDDAARAVMGGTWRMPTITELSALSSNCTWSWTSNGGHYGYLVTASNGNKLFLPAAGFRNETSLYGEGSGGSYWSSTLDTSGSSYGRSLGFYSGSHGTSSYSYRYYGHRITLHSIYSIHSTNSIYSPRSGEAPSRHPGLQPWHP